MNKDNMRDLISKVFEQVNVVDVIIDEMNNEIDKLLPDCKSEKEINERLGMFEGRTNEVDKIRAILVDVVDELKK